MATISNPASFSSVRTAFNAEGYGISTSFFAYRQGGGIVPATVAFNAIGAGSGGDPLRLTQFNGFVVPAAISFDGFTSFPEAIASNLGTARASCSVIFDTSGGLTHNAIASAFPDDGGSYVNPAPFYTTWCIGPNPSDYSLKYTFTSNDPNALRGGSPISQNTWYPFTGDISFEVSASRSTFAGSTGSTSNISISIAKTSHLGTVLDSATITLGPTATVYE